MKILGYIVGFIVLLIGGCTILSVTAVTGAMGVVMDEAEAQAHATLVEQYQHHRVRGLKSIRKNTNFCMQPRLDPNLPASFLIDYNDIQEQRIIAMGAGTSDAEHAALLFKQQKLAHMLQVGQSLPGRQKRALKTAIKNFDTSNTMTTICIATKVDEELGEIVKSGASRSANYRRPNSPSTRSQKFTATRSVPKRAVQKAPAKKPAIKKPAPEKQELPQLRGAGQ